ncbi:hypothetical protein KMW28_14545 [Flammeovirga yaeyamensis]|uniref:Uncharacterized protein n=1 Tax=Flammeovirga yaeyamensis TaxID=367791 RepID=A0AAX1N045_9BACT|nr:hypothetical protein [Flammeovirga yaeyamensis]MBB3700189.1 hypothetical protein [Flammeovirga yaeyamensis]NMF37181.1 hypothetical protein [Flammeovirga yaeyamensis]QWG00871.1 hypothetical protein KMW28_14545 [Flammeovirga yaeyamensis]
MRLLPLKPLLVVFIMQLFFCCSKNDVENPNLSDDILPVLTLTDSSQFLRQTTNLSISLSEYDQSIISVGKIELSNNGNVLSEAVISENGDYVFEVDSKQMKDGIHDFEVMAEFLSVNGSETSKKTFNFSMEVDNYFPSIVIDQGYLEFRSQSPLKITFSDLIDLDISVFFANKEGVRITDIYNFKDLEGDAIDLEIPEDNTSQEFYLVELETYQLNSLTPSTESEKNKNISLKKIYSNEASIEYINMGEKVTKEVSITYPKQFDDHDISVNLEAVTTVEENNLITKTFKVNDPDYWNYDFIFPEFFRIEKSTGGYIYVMLDLIETGTPLVLKEEDFSTDYFSQIFNSDALSVESNHYISFTLYGVYNYNGKKVFTNFNTISSTEDGRLIKCYIPLNAGNENTYLIDSYVTENGKYKSISRASTTLPFENYLDFVPENLFNYSVAGNKVILESSLTDDDIVYRFQKKLSYQEGEYLIKNEISSKGNHPISIDLNTIDFGLEEYKDPSIANIISSNNAVFGLRVHSEHQLSDQSFSNSWNLLGSSMERNYVELNPSSNRVLVFKDESQLRR